MLQLRRTVRFCLNGREGTGDARPAPPRSNTFSAWPPMRGLGRFYQLHVQCAGEADPVTGYFMNIKRIDQAVRHTLLPDLEQMLADGCDSAAIPMGELMRRMITRLQPALDHCVERITFDLTPFHNIEIGAGDMSHVTLRQQYEFAAAHRLHVQSLSDEQNRDVFGKCNNPSGHGHNYRLEVAIHAPIDARGQTIHVEDLDTLVDQTVIEKLDHKHLNIDVPQFKDLNPSVENIAKVIHGMLHDRVATLGVRLASVTVWETGKTQCTYAGER